MEKGGKKAERELGGCCALLKGKGMAKKRERRREKAIKTFFC
jgi:hypothetical protein